MQKVCNAEVQEEIKGLYLYLFTIFGTNLCIVPVCNLLYISSMGCILTNKETIQDIDIIS